MSDKEQRALLHDMTICSGCGDCVAACNEAHGIEIEGEPDAVDTLSATALTALIPIDDDNTARHLCRHCLTPACASVCPVTALTKTPEGPILYEAEKCMGCRYCMLACPFNVPTYEWDKRVPSIRKCDMCADRFKEGKTNACVELCPQEATIAGTREELLAEAHRRIEESPEDYYDHVYGEHEVGGTSVLFLTPFPVPQLGYKAALGSDPLPARTWTVLSKIPNIALFAGATMGALWWLTGRRDEVRVHEHAQRRPNSPKHNGQTNR